MDLAAATNQTAASSIFDDAINGACDVSHNTHCVAATFAVTPVTLVFAMLLPFLLQWFETYNSLENVHIKRKRFHVPHIVRVTASIGLLVAASFELAARWLGDSFDTDLQAGEYVQLISAIVIWFLHALWYMIFAGGPISVNALRVDAVTDYLRFWYIAVFVAYTSQAIATTVSDDENQDTALMGTAWLNAGLSLTLVLPGLARCFQQRRSPEGTPLIDAESKPNAVPEYNPVEEAGVWARATYTWMDKLMRLGYKRPLEQHDLPPLPRNDLSSVITAIFEKNWTTVEASALHRASVAGWQKDATGAWFQGKDLSVGSGYQAAQSTEEVATAIGSVRARYHPDYTPSVAKALAKAYFPALMAGVLFKFVYDLLVFVGPNLLDAIISYLSDVRDGVRTEQGLGYAYVAVLFGSSVIQTVCLHQYFFRVFRLGMNLRSTIVLAVYRKALRLSVTGRQEKSVGEIVNIMSTDATRMQDLTTYLNMLWSAPLQIILSMYFLWDQIQEAVFAGIAVMIVFIPVNMFFGRWQKNLQTKLMKIKDKRVNLTNETLNGIKLIKLSGWEDEFALRIQHMRDQELAQLKRYAILNQATTILWGAVPLLVALASFATYTTVMDKELTAAKAFTSLALFNVLRFPMSMLPMVINNLIEATVSLKRIRDFLATDEVDPSAVERTDKSADPFDISAPLPQYATDGVDESVAIDGAGVNLTMDESVSGGDAIIVENGDFVWPVAEAPAPDASAPDGPMRAASERVAAETTTSFDGIKGLNWTVPKGDLLCIVGAVGSGKTSMMMALLGEMLKLKGRVALNGTVSFVSQTAFIMNATVRDNILFGRAYNEHQYRTAVRVCNLESDLAILPAGDQTEIGERGINLSGGQRQRVSLARAVYADAEIVLMDDCLSAVDPQVGNLIFADCILGHMRHKTRVLVTHGIQYISHPAVSKIAVLHNGAMVEHGDFNTLNADTSSMLSLLVQKYKREAEDAFADAEAAAVAEHGHDGAGAADDHIERRRLSSDGGSDGEARENGFTAAERAHMFRDPDAPANDKSDNAGKLMSAENRTRGTVGWGVFKAYIAVLGGYGVASLIMLLFAAYAGSTVMVNWWLSHWSSDRSSEDGSKPSADTKSNSWYLGIYAALSVGSIAIAITVRLLAALRGVTAAKILHERLVQTVLRAYMSFFDTTPLGRILNRFSQDQYTIDEKVNSTLVSFLQMLFGVSSTLVVICVVTPWFIVGILPVAALYIFSQRYYVATSRELQRLDSVSRSPIYAHFNETLLGAVTIRAYNDEHRFIAANERKLDENQRAYFLKTTANRWLATRLEFAGAIIVALSALFAVIARNDINAALAGLSISYALSITQALNWSVRMSSDAETQIVSVERVSEYTALNTEPKGSRAAEPGPEWPSEGAVEIRDLSMRYRPHLPQVLKKISLKLRAGEKVGICGRTGAGKSSFVSALFRLADEQTGSIIIDGVDIADISLARLRRAIAIIPQEPTLFAGSLRYNLDPLNKHGDAEVWRALQQVSLREKVSTFPDQLESHVSDGGENWSHGERQLICMARALLQGAKVVVMDEATASVDVHTEALLQQSIRTEFKHATVLTIAHRVHTILESDRVIVMDKGQIGEFDSPSKLLSRPTSLFSQLMAETHDNEGEDA